MPKPQIKYRPKEPSMIASAKEINGEPVWAEICRRGVDLGLLYITKGQQWHIWLAYASDDDNVLEFGVIEEFGINYRNYKSALLAAIELSG
jgi:hypothetical protein